MSSADQGPRSVCVYCGSSNGAAEAYIAAAARFGEILADAGIRLVYGGGGMGLMGAVARAAHGAGGAVLGVIPEFLTSHERTIAEIDTLIVSNMHERKMTMFEAADAFVVLPGAIGTLEEAVELLSWRRLGLHAKPIVFFNPDGFWDPLFELFQSFTARRLMPPEFAACWRVAETIEDVLPAVMAMPAEAAVTVPIVQRA